MQPRMLFSTYVNDCRNSYIGNNVPKMTSSLRLSANEINLLSNWYEHKKNVSVIEDGN